MRLESYLGALVVFALLLAESLSAGNAVATIFLSALAMVFSASLLTGNASAVNVVASIYCVSLSVAAVLDFPLPVLLAELFTVLVARDLFSILAYGERAGTAYLLKVYLPLYSLAAIAVYVWLQVRKSTSAFASFQLVAASGFVALLVLYKVAGDLKRAVKEG
ncbi:hypothetical protein [Thermofilum pendens]|uniref:Uncharacterized protein n=1 Tax=Thermofilum pendens (strain DSM 2475 / Hrk 5) TaxID=368408 RepID=A1RWJ6_THEPD|nr:hypothetical protein [Thermofilum pendens]ABL77576.1 hypothetical protein Tpen_0166 [Thermofilum pendens Hrk 5]